MAELRITELDFNKIKTNLKGFLTSQTEFTDYNFDGSGMSVFLDVLAYNTHYNAMLAHLQANELFIDSAIKRSSVISHAKTLGYIPKSATAARATVRIEITPPTVPTSASPLLLPKYSKFLATVNDVNFSFNTFEEYTADYNPILNKYIFTEVVLLEGNPVTNRFLVNEDTASGPFVLANSTVDTTSIRVRVKETTTSSESEIFKPAYTVVDVDENSRVFWTEETPDSKYKLILGDNTFGKRLESGNEVLVDYQASTGDTSANGARTFSFSGTIGGYSAISVITEARAAGGSPRESIDSIRFNAPRFYSTRNRIITQQDYRTVLRARYPFIKGIVVWGGEENVPPIYGKVFISIDTDTDFILTTQDKQVIINNILKPATVLGIQHEFVAPEYLYVGVSADIRYNPAKTNKTPNDLAALISFEIQDYFRTQLSTLDKVFYYSKLLRFVDDSAPEIVGSQISLRLQRRIIPAVSTAISTREFFTTALEPNSIFSTRFRTVVGGTEYTVHLQDVPKTTPPSTTGSISLIDSITGATLDSEYGTVEYSTGVVSLTKLLVTGYLGNVKDVRLHATPEDLFYNLQPSIVNSEVRPDFATLPFPAKNIIMRLDDSSENRLIGQFSGLTVRAIPTKES